jgi:DNA-binding beta-propeller fold protein YncE
MNYTLGIVDPEAGKQIAVIPVGGVTGHEVAASPGGRTAWVPIYGGEPQSHMVAISSDGTRGYSMNAGSGTISVLDLQKRAVINLASRKVEKLIAVGTGADGLAWAPAK